MYSYIQRRVFEKSWLQKLQLLAEHTKLFFEKVKEKRRTVHSHAL